MKERARQVAVLNIFYEHTLMRDTPQVRVYTNADIPKSLLTQKFVFILTLAILPIIDHDSYDNFNKETVSDNWYNNDTLVGEIR